MLYWRFLLYWLGEPQKTPEQEEWARKNAKLNAEKEKYNGFKYTCPMCGSHKIRTVGAASRMAGVFTLGLASKRTGRLYQCDDCNYTW